MNELLQKTKNVEIKPFYNESFGRMRVFSINKQPFFLGIDVARALGYTNPIQAVKTNCKLTDEHAIYAYIPHEYSVGGTYMIAVDESNLYRLIMRSQLQSSFIFQDWVFEEVLPQINKTGRYIPEQENGEALLARAVVYANKRIAEMSNLLAAQKPKVDYYKKVVEQRTFFTTTTIANELNVSAIFLNRMLAELNIILYDSNKRAWIPGMGYEKYITYDGSVYFKWTPAGREYLIKTYNAYRSGKLN